jgi:hypothetical protein
VDTAAGGEAIIGVGSNGLAALLADLHETKDAGAVWHLLPEAAAVRPFLVSMPDFKLRCSTRNRHTLGITVLVVVSLVSSPSAMLHPSLEPSGPRAVPLCIWSPACNATHPAHLMLL